MSFLYRLIYNIIPHNKIVYKNRKEKIDSHVAITPISQIHHYKERASAFTSMKGSLTLEAAMVVPLFFFAMLSLAYLLEMMSIQTTMRNALCHVGKEAAQKVYVSSFLGTDEMEDQIIQNIGEEWLDKSIVAGGASGIDCSETTCNWNTGVLDLSVKYRVEIPVLMFRIAPISCEETLRIKGWNGYASTLGSGSTKETVYITETGIVYHKDADCTYLDMSIKSVRTEDISELRNQSGGKYYPCESCGQAGETTQLCYITDYGNRYHRSLDCKKIKRTVYAISLDETYGLGGCSKCVK